MFDVRCSSVSRKAAFTMVEIALCLGVIGFALVAIIGILPSGMSVQKDNREETVVNFDGTFLMNAIRSGAQGEDTLTNFVINITNYYNLYSNGIIVSSGLNWYTTSGFSSGGNAGAFNVLTNGANIIGLLSLPKYQVAGANSFYSNYTTADFRGLTGDAVDQGTNSGSQDFAFKYRVYCEIMPSASYAFADPSWVNLTAPGIATNVNPTPYALPNNPANDLQNNFNQVRLRYRWPILPNGQTANGRMVFRSSVSGVTISNTVPYGGVSVTYYYLQPGML